jgi:hypothetical protein
MGRRQDLERRRTEAERATAIDAARRLAAHLAGGGFPLPQGCSIRLDAGEHGYGETAAGLWQYWGRDTYWYNRYGVHPDGGIAALFVTNARNDAAERRARAEAAPQWRYLGPVPVIVTNTRLLARQEGQWISWTYQAVREIIPDPDALVVDLYLEGTVPARFSGTSAPWLSVLLVYLLYGQILTLG